MNEDLMDERLHFHPKIWWDPIPPWLRERLDERVLVGLTKIQLQKQATILGAELQAVQETLKMIG